MDMLLYKKFITFENINKKNIDDFLKDNKITTNIFIRELFKIIFTTDDIKENEIVISKTINALCFIFSYAQLTEDEVEINRNRIKKARIILLSYLKSNKSETIRTSCNKLDEIVLRKQTYDIEIINIIIEIINNQEDVEIIKKIISLNKNCIFYNDSLLFDYVFYRAIDAYKNESYLINYYITLLKLFYNTKIKKDKYIKTIKSLPDDMITNEIYNILFGDKRFLSTTDILTKYDKEKSYFNKQIIVPSSTIIKDESIITIDGFKTHSKDDAIRIRKDGSKYIVSIYIADVGGNIPYGSILDKQAMMIFKSSYLKDRNITIFPKSTLDKMSLNESKERNAIILDVILSDSGDIIDYSIRKGSIIVSENLTYFGVDNILDHKSSHELQKNLEQLFDLASALRIKSKGKEKYWSSKEKSKIYKRLYETKSHMIVGEFSILYNMLLAMNSKTNNIPFVYRTQDKSYFPELFDEHKIELDSESERIINSIFLEGYYSITPRFHYGLLIDEYCQASSPLRKYGDTFDQYLLHKYHFKDINFNDDNLDEIIRYFNMREFDTRLFEEEYNRSAMLLKKKTKKN